MPIRSTLRPAFLVFVALTAACRSAARWSGGTFLHADLGSFQRAITTRSRDAQRFFDQGLVLAFAFNHDEAIRSFEEAARLDPTCAMAWWGVALANGPHINNPEMDAERSAAAWKALTRARELAPGASALERELIEAMGNRYAFDWPGSRQPLDQAYADAMGSLWSAHADDADIGVLYAEALMDLQPWDLWTHAGEPKLRTTEIVATLEAVLALEPEHPGANHLYIHAMEASLHPEKAAVAADRLRTLVPGAGHLLHMPAHIDVRLGRYAAASLANERAIAADRRHRELYSSEGFYRIYMAHNWHFLAYSSMMEGRSQDALRAARTMLAEMPAALVEQMGPLVDGLIPIALHVLVRFGRWEEILREPAFPQHLVVSNSMHRYARGVSLAALGRADEAEAECAELDRLAPSIDEKQTVGNSPARAVVALAQAMLAGEIAYRRGRADEAFALLRQAVEAEDALVYDEPPDWMMHVRHALGAALVQSRRFAEAEHVYRDDLRVHPENGWALYGLARCLRERGPTSGAQAHEVEQRFEKAWARADVRLSSSCFCQPGP